MPPWPKQPQKAASREHKSMWFQNQNRIDTFQSMLTVRIPPSADKLRAALAIAYASMAHTASKGSFTGTEGSILKAPV